MKNRQTALWGGVLGIVVGSMLLHDAYEGRGISRPWLAKWLPGA